MVGSFLGQYDITLFIGPGNGKNLQYLGIIYQYVYLLLIQVLMLNIIIAILGTVYEEFM